MLLTIPGVLAQDEVRQLRRLLDNASWADGRITAGTQSAREKRNRQLPEDAPQAAEARALVLAGLARTVGAGPKRKV